jgi:hypothetical protein
VIEMIKMNKILFIGILSISMFGFANCASGNNYQGLLYTNVSRSLEYPAQVGSKEGTGCQNSVLGLFAWGDSSIPGAAREGKISTVESISFATKTAWFLVPLFRADCIIVTGT